MMIKSILKPQKEMCIRRISIKAVEWHCFQVKRTNTSFKGGKEETQEVDLVQSFPPDFDSEKKLGQPDFEISPRGPD